LRIKTCHIARASRPSLSFRAFRISIAIVALAAASAVAGIDRTKPGKAPRSGDWSKESPSRAGANAEADARGWLGLALDAMGGRAKLESIKSLRTQSTGHTLLTEQSYRQEPFISSYQREKETIDFSGQRIERETHTTWPESDNGQSDFDQTLVATPGGGVYRGNGSDSPCGPADIDSVRDALALGPLRLLLTAGSASDLRLEGTRELRSTAHTVIAFTFQGTPVKVLINRFNHLPDGVETVEQLRDFWYYWGDVTRLVYLDNWQLFKGLVYPTNAVEERNGVLWRSTQVTSLEYNVAFDESLFRMDAVAASKSAQSPGWERAFHAGKPIELAPGISLFPGAWNLTVVRQPDGLVILEAPISGTYMDGAIAEAERMYPGERIKSVLSTSDSWPHVGGVRQCVALGLPVYILDLNQKLLDRIVTARHTLHPDPLAQNPKPPKWVTVSGKTEVGSGENRIELYPLRGASTERQYMVYFPERKVLYASDTLVINQDGSLYDPQLMHEVVQAVAREGLQVNSVYAMHQLAVPWERAAGLVRKATE